MLPNNPDNDAFVLIAEISHTDMRLDQFLANHKNCSRSLAAALIKKSAILVNGQAVKPAHKIKAGETVSGYIPTDPPCHLVPEPIPLDILYEDPYLVVINKAPGLVVHPAPGHESGTLVHGLLSRYPDILTAGGDNNRPGIVHRLDKDTSGAIIVARSQAAFEQLSDMFAARKVLKKYLALVYGAPREEQGSIQLPIGRHLTDRKKMSTSSKRGRPAETNWRVLKQFNDAGLLEVTIKTGRTHQIRVHCAASGTPVVGDRTYSSGWTRQPARFTDKAIFRLLKAVPRQMLHAWKLEFTHPTTNKKISCTAPLAADMKELLREINRSDN